MMVSHIVHQQKYYSVDPAVPENEYRCPWCSSVNHSMVRESQKTVWICQNPNCETIKNIPLARSNNPKRAIPFEKICQDFDIGNRFWRVSFDKIHPSAKKDKLERFAYKPEGLVIMQGDPGTGKTFACLGVLELYSKSSPDCLFLTGATLKERWTQFYKGLGSQNFKARLKETPLLIIDDFGTGIPSPMLMEFLMDIIDHRIQWTNKGTIISTNLKLDKLSEVCGEALSDRLQTGTLLTYDGESKRGLD